MAQAILRSQSLKAVKGNGRAQRNFLELVRRVEAEDAALAIQNVDEALQHKAGWKEEIERRKAQGIVRPDPDPHPDDVLRDRHRDGPRPPAEGKDR
jgi:hypothetical protein